MDVRAIVLLGAPAEKGTESLGGVPIPLLDVLGQPMLRRVTARMKRAGIGTIRIIGDAGPHAARFLRRALQNEEQWEQASAAALWRAAQRAFTEYAQSGADTVLVMRVGPYAELEIERLMQFHLNQNGRVTAVTAADGQMLGTFLIAASRRNDAAFLLRNRLTEFRTPFAGYRHEGYVNRLAGAADLRQLAVDAFSGRAEIVPVGEQVKPGVWVGAGARIHRGARVLAPAYIGEQSRVRAAAVITRCSALEHHTEVDCGTVVEDTSLLPCTMVGAGLDLAHSVVGLHRIFHLRRMVEVEVLDPKLVSLAAPAPVRMLNRMASLATYLPASFLRGLFGVRQNTLDPASAAQAPSAALNNSESLSITDPALSNYR
jgi:NDP-sugar pyrophosphorylase family protein